MSEKEQGLYSKFIVTRTDGKSAPGQKHDGCEYFVLDVTHDKHSHAALIAYAKSCEAEYPLLARDLRIQAKMQTIGPSTYFGKTDAALVPPNDELQVGCVSVTNERSESSGSASERSAKENTSNLEPAAPSPASHVGDSEIESRPIAERIRMYLAWCENPEFGDCGHSPGHSECGGITCPDIEPTEPGTWSPDDLLREALDALGPEPWASIETAPKDGRHILFTCDWGVGPRIVVGWWDDLAEGWYATPCVKGLKALSPVHWTPLPSPPEAK